MSNFLTMDKVAAWVSRYFWRKGETIRADVLSALTDAGLSIYGAVGFGVAPQGRLHAHDGTGGFMFVTKANINATPQTIIANGTGDIVRAANLEGVAWDGTAVSYIAAPVTPGGSFNVSPDAGTNQITVTCAADGSLTVARTAGSRTWSISVHIVWL